MLRTKSLDARKFELMALAHIERRAKRIKQRREELHLTQEQIADRMQDIHRELHPDEERDRTRGQMVSDWERAVNEPSPPKLELLALALEWTVADLNADQPAKATTPDLLGNLNRTRDIAARLDSIDDRLEILQEAVIEIVGMLEQREAREMALDELAAGEQSGATERQNAPSGQPSGS